MRTATEMELATTVWLRHMTISADKPWRIPSANAAPRRDLSGPRTPTKSSGHLLTLRARSLDWSHLKWEAEGSPAGTPLEMSAILAFDATTPPTAQRFSGSALTTTTRLSREKANDVEFLPDTTSRLNVNMGPTASQSAFMDAPTDHAQPTFAQRRAARKKANDVVLLPDTTNRLNVQLDCTASPSAYMDAPTDPA